ncbi:MULTISPECIES: ribosome maturation factor RimP [Anaerotruncus]|uniref:Ribosome maturation factor RimP n=2 Tax=Anaerotruncus TaxID=244127 RepID=A0A498CLR8_9FIRM|nr:MULTISPECIES: ribosome maturation factor RimP [Anaerotruncus]MBC3939619.1 ribosome maturation factor RimP [Anaerotruncus massiliensis (ex Togo et al. 2019)]MCQ4896973.1 ribosome maturation factor RimP [Anaerotruncus sp. DFI.9.16]RLL08659.1 ribosome maturation factor RimP [Anaerotruncus massiliensis (ex Liu et al. 2021)]GKH45926.1 ribosome maturation factor RimP [Oscillospiraceae bacterium]
MTQPKGKRPNTAAVCAELAAPVAEGIGVYLWDVVFEKEGAGWYLRYFIDKDADGGVTIDECEAFSRAMSDLLDEKDPIPQSYTLEVGSPGVERRLTKDWHFRKYLGSDVLVRLIRPVEGERDFIGTLSAYHEDGTISVELDGDVEMAFTLAETAFVRLYEEF